MFDLEISYHLNHNNENNNDVTIRNMNVAHKTFLI